MKKNILLSVISGLLLWLSWPPLAFTTFALFFALVPVLVLIERIIKSDTANKGKAIFWTTFIGFFIWNSLSVYWVYDSIRIVGALIAIPITLIPFSLGPLLMSTACWLYYRMRCVTNRNFSLAALVCFWIAYEFLHQSWDLSFPWMTLGNGFATSHQWIQWYQYTGVYGGTIWIWSANILIFLLYMGVIETQDKKRRLNLVSAMVAVIILPLSFSELTYTRYTENVNPSNIVIAQPNVDPYASIASVPVFNQINTLCRLSDSIGQHNTEFFIWPESAIPELINEDGFRNHPYYTQVARFLNKYKNGNVIAGVETSKIYNSDATPSASRLPNGNQYYDVFNAVVNIENSATLQFYHKSKLVPGVEEMPFGTALSFLKPVFEHFGGATGSYGRQAEPGVFYSQEGIGAAPVICYESIWGGYVASYVKKGAQFIAIITNDGWFDDSSGKDQHLLYAKLRAIETRRWVCQSANTGISAFINQRGDVVQQTKWWTRTAIKHDINLNTDITFYVRFGDYIPAICSVLAAGLMLYLLFFQISLNFKRQRPYPKSL